MAAFVIEKIIKEDVNLLGDTYVRVKWEGFPDSYNSWILKSSLEENSDSTDDAQPECPADRGNFISASDAIANVLAYRSLAAYNYPDVLIDSYYFQKLDVKRKNYLLVWNHDEHLYVICAFRGQVWLADGVDHCHINSRVRGLVRKHVSWKISLGSVGRQQSGDDHCGSSAVLIALEYLRMMGNGEVHERLLFPGGLKKKLVRKLHPNDPVKRSGEPSQVRLSVDGLVCRYCQASYKNKGSARLKMHERKCKGRPLH